MKHWISAKINDIKLRQKLVIAFLCLNIAATGLVVSFIITRTSRTMYQEAGNSALIASDQIKENLRNKLLGYVGVSDIYYGDLYFQALLTEQYASDFDSLMMYQNYTHPNMQRNLNQTQYNRISIYLSNESYLKDGALFVDEKEIADKEYAHKTVAERGRICWSAPERNAQGQVVFYMTRMLNALDTNHPSGLFLMEIPSEQLFSLFAHEAIEKEILIVNADGVVLCASESPLIGQAAVQTHYAPLFERPDGQIHSVDRDGMPVNAILESITIPGSSGAWRMLSLIPMDKMYANINEVLRQSLWVIGIGLALSAVLIWLLSNGLTKRLRLLSSNIAQVKEQHFDRTVSISGRDEIGMLASDFHQMAARVDELINQVYKEQLAKMDLLVRQREAELDALQSRINPHFLFNTLDSVRMHTILDEKEKAAQMITALCELFRYGVGKGEDEVTLGAELINIRDFVGIFMLRYDGRIRAEIDVPDQMLERPVPRLILQPIVENAFIHGLRNPRGVLLLRIYAVEEGGAEWVVVEDDGCGIEASILAKLNAEFAAQAQGEREHIGLMNVSHRLCLFYGEAFHLRMQSEHGLWTRVYMPIPKDATSTAAQNGKEERIDHE